MVCDYRVITDSGLRFISRDAFELNHYLQKL